MSIRVITHFGVQITVDVVAPSNSSIDGVSIVSMTDDELVDNHELLSEISNQMIRSTNKTCDIIDAAVFYIDREMQKREAVKNTAALRRRVTMYKIKNAMKSVEAGGRDREVEKLLTYLHDRSSTEVYAGNVFDLTPGYPNPHLGKLTTFLTDDRPGKQGRRTVWFERVGLGLDYSELTDDAVNLIKTMQRMQETL